MMCKSDILHIEMLYCLGTYTDKSDRKCEHLASLWSSLCKWESMLYNVL